MSSDLCSLTTSWHTLASSQAFTISQSVRCKDCDSGLVKLKMWWVITSATINWLLFSMRIWARRRFRRTNFLCWGITNTFGSLKLNTWRCDRDLILTIVDLLHFFRWFRTGWFWNLTHFIEHISQTGLSRPLHYLSCFFPRIKRWRDITYHNICSQWNKLNMRDFFFIFYFFNFFFTEATASVASMQATPMMQSRDDKLHNIGM